MYNLGANMYISSVHLLHLFSPSDRFCTFFIWECWGRSIDVDLL